MLAVLKITLEFNKTEYKELNKIGIVEQSLLNAILKWKIFCKKRRIKSKKNEDDNFHFSFKIASLKIWLQKFQSSKISVYKNFKFQKFDHKNFTFFEKFFLRYSLIKFYFHLPSRLVFVNSRKNSGDIDVFSKIFAS